MASGVKRVHSWAIGCLAGAVSLFPCPSANSFWRPALGVPSAESAEIVTNDSFLCKKIIYQYIATAGKGVRRWNVKK